MALILSQSRLRMTQAKFFGKAYLAAGTGFLKDDGTTPLTADWNAGNYVIRSKNSNGWINVSAAATGGSGTVGSPWTGWDTQITWAANTEYVFPAGYYSYAASPNFALEGIRLRGEGHATVLVFTGAGPAVTFTGVPTLDIGMEGFLITGNAACTEGLAVTAIQNSHFKDILVLTGSVAAVDLVDVITTEFDHILVTNNEGAYSPTPAIGFQLRGSGPGMFSGSNIFRNLSAQNCTGSGIYLSEANTNIFIGGTSSDNNIGLELTTWALGVPERNVFIGMDLEMNAVDDLKCGGRINSFYSMFVAGPTHVTNGANSNTFIGGAYQGITIDAVSDGNSFINVCYSAAGAFVDNGTSTTKLQVYNRTTTTFDTSVVAANFDVKGTFSKVTGTAARLIANVGTADNGGVEVSSTAANAPNVTMTLQGLGATPYAQIEAADALLYRNIALAPSGGNVGIATTSPTRPLDLNGTQRFRGIAAPAVSEANSATLYFDSTANTLKASLNGSAYVNVLGSGGLTGSGTATKIGYWDGATSLAGVANIYADAVNHRLGIKVASPSFDLDVDGDINLTAGSVFRVDGGSVLNYDAGNLHTLVGRNSNASPGIGTTSVGAQCLENATGDYNTAVGWGALNVVSTGVENTAVGNLALAVTTGDKNTAVGYNAGFTNTAGDNNIFVGHEADCTGGNLTNAVAIGYQANVAASDSMSLGNASMKVGIHTSTPKTALDVNGAVATRHLDIVLAAGPNNDIALTDSSWIRITGPAGGFAVSGFTNGTDGRQLTIYNTTTEVMTITNAADSAAANQILTLTGADVVLAARQSSATFIYEDVQDKWILVSYNG